MISVAQDGRDGIEKGCINHSPKRTVPVCFELHLIDESLLTAMRRDG